VGQYDQEMAAAAERYGPLYDRFLAMDLADVAVDPEARKMGRRLFVNYCAGCHGSDAGGNPGIPSLRDDDWLYGGDPSVIKTTILKGRTGVMPPWEQALGEEGVKNVAQYVLSLNGREADEAAAKAGGTHFKQLCANCHGAEGTGNKELGAPNLTNNIWLYGGSPQAVESTIAKGRMGQMPPHEEFLGEAKSHVLAGYVYGLSRQ
jgi:cytochrome c oxidase cbb3-type subunit 3